MRPPLFVDDDCVATALDEAADAAAHRLAALLPDMDPALRKQLRTEIRSHVADLLTGRQSPDLPRLVYGNDAFGDPFCLGDLPLPRPGTGYAVQLLDTDTLLDRATGQFRAVRDTALSGLFESFDAARSAARRWLQENEAGLDQYPLAIVPAYYDDEMDRHVLIYGVLTQSP